VCFVSVLSCAALHFRFVCAKRYMIVMIHLSLNAAACKDLFRKFSLLCFPDLSYCRIFPSVVLSSYFCDCRATF